MSEPQPVLRRVALGRSSVELTEIVLGCAPLAGLFKSVSEEVAAETVDAAFEVGIRAFDTAPHYGVGLSEERLGAALRGRPRSEYVVSTKVGRILVENRAARGEAGHAPGVGDEGFFGTPARSRVRDYSADGVRRSLEASLERLGLDRVDVALIHDPDDFAEQALTEAYPALEDLRSQGVVRAIGVGMNQVELLERFAVETDIDCVLVAGRCSLLDQSATLSLLPACAARGVGVIAAGVYNSGILADPRPGATYDYAPAPAALLAKAEAIRAVCASHGTELPAAALHFALAQPGVSAIALGARSPEEVRDNARHLAASVPPELFEDLAVAGLLGARARE